MSYIIVSTEVKKKEEIKRILIKAQAILKEILSEELVNIIRCGQRER